MRALITVSAHFCFDSIGCSALQYRHNYPYNSFILSIFNIMGVLKLVLFLLVLLILGGGFGVFMSKNDMEIPVLTLLQAEPLVTTVGLLSTLSFFAGLILGVLICAAYILLQFIELQGARRKLAAHQKKLDAMQSSSFKDAP
ncbi:MAG: LapA family protein [Pseudomonadales bacterium]|nr:LapA family protein [Pseudomonadales bacterium]